MTAEREEARALCTCKTGTTAWCKVHERVVDASPLVPRASEALPAPTDEERARHVLHAFGMHVWFDGSHVAWLANEFRQAREQRSNEARPGGGSRSTMPGEACTGRPGAASWGRCKKPNGHPPPCTYDPAPRSRKVQPVQILAWEILERMNRDMSIESLAAALLSVGVQRKRPPGPPPPLSSRQIDTRERLLWSLRQNGGNISRTAREMGKSRSQIQRWLRRFKIDPHAGLEPGSEAT